MKADMEQCGGQPLSTARMERLAIAWYTRHLGFQLDGIAHPELASLHLPLGPHLLLWKTRGQTTATFTKNGETMPVMAISSRHIQRLHDELQRVGSVSPTLKTRDTASR
jgi:hypothetical protein